MMLTADDRLNIQDTVVRYGHLVDDRDWERFGEVFTEDAVVDFSRDGPPRSGLAPIVGLAEIVRQYRDVLLHPLQHVLAYPVLEEVAEDRAVARTKALFPVSGGRVFEGLYRDVLVQTPRGWRIGEKSIVSFDATITDWALQSYEEMRLRGAVFLEG